MNSKARSLYFYQFLGAQSLLIGLLPFFLPVYLWKQGLGLAGLCVLIGVSGVAFSLSLQLWQRWSFRWPIKRLITLSFVLEILLVCAVGLCTTVPGAGLYLQPGMEYPDPTGIFQTAVVVGIFNGIYNAFFWTTQRTLFTGQLGKNDTGRQYGNFQIFVTLFLKAGILLGGMLLDTGGFVWLLALSAGVGGASSYWLASANHSASPLIQECPTVTSTQSITYKDAQGSRSTFAIDGVFLYLESHFWTLSLFLIVDQEFTNLGFAVVILTLVFSVLFLAIKNGIDRLPVESVYRVSVLLYALSWLLRFTLDEHSEGTNLLVTLVAITFFSTFFRLAFNKRFFDVARRESPVRYLLMKSYSSQWILGVFYLSLGGMLYGLSINPETALKTLYLAAALLSLLYLKYNVRPQFRNSRLVP